MQDNGIPTVVWMPPILHYINGTEENIAGIVRACAKRGVYGIETDQNKIFAYLHTYESRWDGEQLSLFSK